MSDKILVSAPELNDLIKAGNCTVVDCRYDFSRSNKGRSDWLAGHIPGSFYAHLDQDLAARVEDHSGRHPLPTFTDFAGYLASIGWTEGDLLLAYDEGSNAIAARLWWMMQYFGQPSALLDGGLRAWIEAGFALEEGETEVASTAVPALVPVQQMTVTTGVILDSLGSGELLVLDARAPERYAGEVEYLDTKAGHIPGAMNRPFGDNLDDAGRFRDPEILRAQFEEVLGSSIASNIVHSCGSGVTACHNLFAMQLAGMDSGRLYPGSWSEWIRDPERPLETGRAS